MSNIQLFNEDCMALMARYPDGYFDLAVVDPPYGIKESSFRANPSKCAAKKRQYNTSLWKQDKPDEKYFLELMRVSKNQIVWGGNYFTSNLPESRCWIIWDKCTQDSLFADVEMAWSSFDKSARLFTFRWNGMLQGDMKNKETRIHPTQKPVKLYQWVYDNFAEPSFKVIDTHLGSASSAIAADQYGISEFVGCEINEDYYHESAKRFNLVTSQQSLFKAS